MKKQIIGWALVFILAGVWYSFAQTICTESRCYKLQDELGFYIDTGNPLPVETHTFVAANTLCNENRCVKLVDKNGFYIDANNPLPTTGGGGGGGGVTSITFSSPLTGGTITTTGTVGCQVASGSLAGCLSSADWTTFNSKVGTARQINTTIPLGGGGSLSGDLTLTCSTCGITTNPLSQFASTTSAQLLATLSNPTGTGLAVFNNTPAITTPKITTGLFDANGVGIISWPLVASQVTNLLVTPSVSGNPSTLTLGPNSSDSNVNLILTGKGSGSVCIVACSPASGPLSVGDLIVTQSANGDTAVQVTRATDTSPTGNFFNLRNAASAALYTVDITGKWVAGILGGITVTLGSDATGDIWYRNSSGIFTRLGIGAATTVLHGGASIPVYSAVSLTADVSGILPVANGGTGTASTLTGLVRGNASAMTAAELSGDATTSGSNAVTVIKVNGVTINGTPSAGQVPVASNSTTAAWGSYKSAWMGSPGGPTSGNGTNYFPTQGQNFLATETSVQAVSAVAGTLKNLNCFNADTLSSTQTWTFNVRKNAGASGITCNMVGATTTCSDVSHTAAVAVGDRFAIELVGTNAPASSHLSCGIEFDVP